MALYMYTWTHKNILQKIEVYIKYENMDKKNIYQFMRVTESKVDERKKWAWEWHKVDFNFISYPQDMKQIL